MKWFKCFEPKDPVMEPIFTEFGYAGYGVACAILAEAQKQGIYEIDLKRLCLWSGLRKDRAEKLLPFLQNIPRRSKMISEDLKMISEDLKMISEDPKMISEDLKMISEDLKILTPQTHVAVISNILEENRIEENRDRVVFKEEVKQHSFGPHFCQNAQSKIFENLSQTNSTLPEKDPQVKSQTKKETPSRGSRLPLDWSPSETLSTWAKKERPDIDTALESASFRDYWTSLPGQRGAKLDWDATYRNWIRRAIAKKASPKDLEKAKYLANFEGCM